MMTVTPNDILTKEFNHKFRGYDAEQVNDYLDIVRVELERVLEENRTLTKNLADAQDKLDYFAQLQESLNSSIIIAQEAADRLKQNARKEAELILYEAERDADQVINEANERATRIFDEAERLRSKTSEYQNRARKLAQEQLDLLDSDDLDVLFEDTALMPAQAPTSLDKDSQYQASQRVSALVEQAESEIQEGLDAIPEDVNHYLDDPSPITEEEVVFLPEVDPEDDLEMTQVFNLKELQAIERAKQEDPSYHDDQVDTIVDPAERDLSDEEDLDQTIQIDLPSKN